MFRKIKSKIAVLLAVALLTAASAYGSLVGYWKFDEFSSSLVNDSSGNGNTGTIYGGDSWSSGKYGNALSFDGWSGYVDCAPGASLDISGSFTIAAWVEPNTSAGSRNSLTKDGSASGIQLEDGNYVQFYCGGGSLYGGSVANDV